MVKSILVATPHAAFGELIRLSLEENGSYHVTLAQSGSDAQKQAAQQPFDVAILDSELNDSPFPNIAQTIKRCRQTIKIVAALPSTSHEDPALGGVTVDGYLRKPFYLPDLLGVIGRLTSDDFMSAADETDSLAALRDPRQATQLLAHLLPESMAQGALITQGNRIVAVTGSLSQPAANEVAGILEHTTRKTDLVRFIHLDNKDYQLFATTLAEDFMLAAVFEATTSLTHIRSQVGRLAIALTTPVIQADRGPIPAGAYAPLGVTAPLVSRSFIPQPAAPTMPLTSPAAFHPQPESSAEETEASQQENIDIHELLPDVPPPDPDTLPQPDWLKELDDQPEATAPAPAQETRFPWEAETASQAQESVPETPAAETAPAEIKFPWEAESAAVGQEISPKSPAAEAAPTETNFPWEAETPAASPETNPETTSAEMKFPWETEVPASQEAAVAEPTGDVAPAETQFPWKNEEQVEQTPVQETPSAPPDFLKAFREPTSELTESASPAAPADIPAFPDTFVPPWEEENTSATAQAEPAAFVNEEPTVPAAAPFLDRFRSMVEETQPTDSTESTAIPEAQTNAGPSFPEAFKLPWEEETPPTPAEAVPQAFQQAEPEPPAHAPAQEGPFAQTASFLDRFKYAPEAPVSPIDEASQAQPAPDITFPPGFVPPWEEAQPAESAENASAEPKSVQASQPEPAIAAERVPSQEETRLPWEEEPATAEPAPAEPVFPEPVAVEAVSNEPARVKPAVAESASAEPAAVEPAPTEPVLASFLPADFKPPWEEDVPATGNNPSEEPSFPWEQATTASNEETQPVRVATKPVTPIPAEVTQPNAVLEPARTFEPPTPAMQTRPLQSPWMTKTHPLARLSEADTAGITQATYTCVIVPRSPLIHLTGNLTEMLSQWVPQLCHSFGWRLNAVTVRSEYLQWTVTMAPSVSPSDMIRILREHTSQRIFENLPRLKPRNPAEEFWANGYLIVNGVEPPAPEVLRDYISQVHKRLGS